MKSGKVHIIIEVYNISVYIDYKLLQPELAQYLRYTHTIEKTTM